MIFIIGINWRITRITRVPQAEQKLAIAANRREVRPVLVAQTFQVRIVHAQLGRFRKVTYDELVGTVLRHVVAVDEVLHGHLAFESAEPVEAAHYREVCLVVTILKVQVEGDDVLAVIKWQHEVIIGANVNWFELSGS